MKQEELSELQSHLQTMKITYRNLRKEHNLLIQNFRKTKSELYEKTNELKAVSFFQLYMHRIIYICYCC